MAQTTPNAIVKGAQQYFRTQLSKSLELVFLIATDPALDRDVEIAGAKQLALEMQQQLAKQHFSPGVRSDAEELLKSINVGQVAVGSGSSIIACIGLSSICRRQT